MPRFTVPIGALAPLLLLAACGGASSSDTNAAASPDAPAAQTPVAAQPVAAPAGTLPDPCSLITVEEVQSIVGVPRVTAQTQRTHMGQECSFGEIHEDGSVTGAASVEINEGPAAMRLFSDMNTTRAEAITGLGDEAYWDGSRLVMVRRGDRLLSAYSVSGNRAQLRERAERLARTATARLD
jgi:hypothetical protein